MVIATSAKILFPFWGEEPTAHWAFQNSYGPYIRFFLFKGILRSIASSTLDGSSYKTQTVAARCRLV